MRLFTIISMVILFYNQLQSQSCDTTALVIHKVTAQATDPNISFELVRHHAFYNPMCTPKNTLLFYMVGTIGKPSNDLLFTKMAANHGYHVISLKYINNKSATTACSTDNDTTCYENFHKEAIFGTDLISAITVDSTNSIYNRALKLLQYLNTTYPTENWGQFLTGNTIDWAKVITGGHSQGSGHAAYLGHLYPVQRVLMFSGPNEYMNNHNRIAPWFAINNTTSDSDYYAFGNTNDEVSFNNQLLVWNKIGLNNYGDTINVNNSGCPYTNRRMLYTANTYTGPITPNHNSTMVDSYTPKDGNGVPVYEEVWKYMLDLCPTTTGIDKKQMGNELLIYPNPAKKHITITSTTVLKDVQVRISNSLGQVMMYNEYTSGKEIKIEIDKSIPKGVYFLSVYAENFIQTKRISIQ